MGRNMSEWHSANKVVWMIDGCISQFFVWNGIRLLTSICSINCGSCLKATFIIRGRAWGQSNRGYFSLRSSYLGLYNCIWDLCWTKFLYVFTSLYYPVLCYANFNRQFAVPRTTVSFTVQLYNYMFQLTVGNIEAIKWFESSTQHV